MNEPYNSVDIHYYLHYRSVYSQRSLFASDICRAHDVCIPGLSSILHGHDERGNTDKFERHYRYCGVTELWENDMVN